MTQVELTRLEIGDVVQLAPGTSFPGCFMLVTEIKPWGAQGFVAIPEIIGKLPNQAYYRARAEDMERIGRAAFVPEDLS